MHRSAGLLAIGVYLAALHVGAVVAPVAHFHWGWLLATLAAWQVFGLIGLPVCLHREISNRAITSVAPVRFLHLPCALVAGQAGPITCASIHRAHHRYSDGPRDAHSPTEGFSIAERGR